MECGIGKMKTVVIGKGKLCETVDEKLVEENLREVFQIKSVDIPYR